jgi:hypothetical protein
MIFYGDEYMHVRPVHCGQPMGPIWVGRWDPFGWAPIWVGPIWVGPLQSHRGLGKGLISTGKERGMPEKRPYGLIIKYELKEIQNQTEAP